MAALGIVAWGRRPSEDEVEQRAGKLRDEISTMDPHRKAVFLAYMSGAPVGFCRMIRDRDETDHWWIAGIVVDPDNRGRGIGRALVSEGIDYARQQGAVVIRSETHTVNGASIGFHEAIGFRNDGPFTAADGDKKTAFSLELGQVRD